jgi:sec-independent protein translocase protein TatA
MFTGFHWWDLLPLVLVALLIWGPKRLPEMGSSIGKTIKEFQKSMREVRESGQTDAVPPATSTVTPELKSGAPASASPELPAPVSATTEPPKE